MNKPIKLGILGAGGYWSANIIRNVLNNPIFELTILCDTNPESLNKYFRLYPCINYRYNYLDIELQDIDAVIVCSPPNSHFELTKYFLQYKKPVLAQKPLSLTLSECRSLDKLAKDNDTILMIGHTFLFHPCIREIKGYLSEIGQIYNFKSFRMNLGIYNRNISILDDLFPHDASILLYLFDELPAWISATGRSHVKEGLIDDANITIGYSSGFQASVSISWLSAIKNRQIIITGKSKTILFDDTKEEKLRYYDAGVDYDEKEMFSYRKGYSVCPKVSNTEAIANELSHFADCVNNKKNPLTNGLQGIIVSKLIEAATLSIKLKGQSIPIPVEI